jgi:hypothetical protein
MLGLLRGSLKFRIIWIGCKVTLTSAFRHGNTFPRAHAVRRALARQACTLRRRNRQLIVVKAVGTGPMDRRDYRRADWLDCSERAIANITLSLRGRVKKAQTPLRSGRGLSAFWAEITAVRRRP